MKATPYDLSLKISIHVPREGDDLRRSRPCPSGMISIHVPREGDDDRACIRAGAGHPISIHVPREGDDV